MSEIKRFEDLDTWQRARELTRLIYEISSSSNFAKDFGLRDQIRRSAVSILSNISEGFERGGNKEFLMFLSYAKGSCGELRSHMYVALDQEYINDEVFVSITDKTIELSKMIAGFMKYLQNSPFKGERFK